DLYRVKMWDPVVPAHGGQAFMRDAQRRVQQMEETAHPQSSQKGTFGEAHVDNPERSLNGTSDAVPKGDHTKKYLEGVPNERNVETGVQGRTELAPVVTGSTSRLTPLGHMLLARATHGSEPPKKHLRDVLPAITTSPEKRNEVLK